jgi:hypothetical protein
MRPATTIAVTAARAASKEYELYVGGPSHLKNAWVWGVIGADGLQLPKNRK